MLPPAIVFHGTIGDAPGAIARDGLRFRRHEASFTTDLVTACCTYGVPGAHPRGPAGDPAAMPPGAVMGVSAPRWRPCPSPTTSVWMRRPVREVRGGITKWIGSYLTLYPSPGPCRRDEYEALFRREALRECADWKRERGEWMSVAPGDLIGPLPVSGDLQAWLLDLEADLRHAARGIAAPEVLRRTFGADGVAAIRLMAQRARFSRWLRRLTLSVLRAAGYRIVQADLLPPEPVREEVLWSEAELRDRSAVLHHCVERFPALAPSRALVLELGRLSEGTHVREDDAEALLRRVERATLHGWPAQPGGVD